MLLLLPRRTMMTMVSHWYEGGRCASFEEAHQIRGLIERREIEIRIGRCDLLLGRHLDCQRGASHRRDHQRMRMTASLLPPVIRTRGMMPRPAKL